MTSLSMTRNIPYFDYPQLFKTQEEDLTQIFQEVGYRGAYILQKDLAEFEKNLAQYTGAKYAIGVANGTDALIIALRAAGIGQGDEVIFCSHTFVATASAIYFAGATPVPVDCREDHLIDPESVRKAITPKTRAIMPTQLNGRTADMDALQKIADEYNLIIIEDAAQGLGSKYKGKDAGTFGLAGTISFYPAKTLGCLGDGGAILTNDDVMYEQMCLLREHGRNPQGEVVCWGLNSRLDNLQAAFLNYMLKEYDQVVARRRELASLYHGYLSAISQLKLPPAPTTEGNHFDIFQNYEIETESRDELKEFLKKNGIGTLIQWGGKAVHQFSGLNISAQLPYVETMFTKCLMLPMNIFLTDDDIAYIAGVIEKFYAK